MNNQKVSVLIPMYNRMQYIEQCIDSALNQDFPDYEIIIRDNCSTDGAYELVQEKYFQQIKEGKVRLYRNDENVGLYGSTKLLINDAKGKYFFLLHSDDMILPHAVRHLYEIAEKSNADVVHQSFSLLSPPSGVIQNIKDCKIWQMDRTVFDKIVIIPDDPGNKFVQWFNYGIYHDAQYNLFNKEFALKNKIFDYKHDYYFTTFAWIMLSKVLVKTPIICYIRRDSQYADSRSSFSYEDFEWIIDDNIRSVKDIDEIFSKIEFFKDNTDVRYMAIARYISAIDHFFITRKNPYKNGITPVIHNVVKKVFQEHFGDDYFYPMFLFHWLHTIQCGQRTDVISTPEQIPPNS